MADGTAGGPTDALAGVASAMLVAPQGNDPEACLPTAGARADLVLRVAFAGEPTGAWEADPAPEREARIVVGEGRRRAGPATPDPTTGSPTAVDVVEDAADVARLGVTASRRLDDWSHRDGRIVLCFRSVTALIDATDLETAYHFLGLLTRQVERTGGVGHYHVDPDRVGAEARATLRPLFDVVVAADQAGGWSATPA